MERTVIPELLDQDLGTPAQIAASLNDLRHINSWFGGVGTTVQLLRRVAGRSGRSEISMLDIGSGQGDVPLEAERVLQREGIEVRATLLDARESHLPRNGAAAVTGDAIKLPFKENSFDIVTCCLLAHHFDWPELRSFAASALRVCRVAVVMNDLIRSPLHLALVYAGLPLFRSRITWHDAPASVRRAYTMVEMAGALEGAPARRLEITQHYLYRMGVVLWK